MEILSNLDSLIMLILSVVGGLVLIVRGLSELAKLTKTEKDDAILAKISGFLQGIADFLDTFTPASKPKDE